MKSSLSNLPIKKTSAEARIDLIPETLKLPDGREVPVKSIAKKVTNKANHNLRTKRVVKIPDNKGKKTCPLKYSVEERQWQSRATIVEIAQKYNITYQKAQNIKYNSKYILNKLDLVPEVD